MTLRDPSELPALTPGDLAALELLRADRDGGCEPGLSPADLEIATGMRHLAGLLKRLRAHGYVIGIATDGRWQLSHDEPASTEASDERRPAPSKGRGPAPAGTIRQASGASVGSELTLFEVAHAHYPEAA